MAKPSNPQGTRDFGPQVMRKREFILDTIRTVFKKYGFEPIETPALELLDTLEGKYGESLVRALVQEMVRPTIGAVSGGLIA